jgi:hypothetical protein
MYIETVGTTTATRTLRIQGANDAGNRYSGIYLQAGAEVISFSTADVERMRITAGGNVGIGTNSPLSKLHVISALGTVGISLGESGNNQRLQLGQEASYTGNFIDSANINLKFYTTTGGGTGGDFRFFTGINGTYTEKLKISAGGQTFVFGSGNSLNVYSDNNSLSLGLGYQGATHGFLGGISSRLEAYSNNGGYVFLNSSSVWVAASDAKRKRNIEDYNLGLDAITSLKPKLYNMDFQKDGDEKQLGLIAQEVKDHLPHAYEDNDGFIGLNYNAIVVTLINAVNELKSENNTLKSTLQRNNIL